MIYSLCSFALPFTGNNVLIRKFFKETVNRFERSVNVLRFNQQPWIEDTFIIPLFNVDFFAIQTTITSQSLTNANIHSTYCISNDFDANASAPLASESNHVKFKFFFRSFVLSVELRFLKSFNIVMYLDMSAYTWFAKMRNCTRIDENEYCVLPEN